MESEKLLFKYRRFNATSKLTKNKKANRSLCTRFNATDKISFNNLQSKSAPFPDLSKTQALLSYMDTYKNLDKVIDRRRHNKTAASPVSSYLTQVKESNLVPGTIGLFNKSRSEFTFDISHYSIGNSYAFALSEGIKLIKLSKAVFKNNRLNDQGGFDLVSKLNPRHLSELNLAENSINVKTIAKICSILELNFSKLSILNLESNNLGDKPVILMVSVLSNYDKITELALSNNQISEYGASALAKYIKNSQILEKLDLHWNSIKGEGAKDLAEALSDNNSIKVLDLSFNSFSSPSGLPVKSLAKAIKQNIKIYHLDLSNNGFNESDCKVLAEALTGNTTLIGLHMQGNGAKIDAKGFLTVDVTSSRVRNLHIYTPLMTRKRRKDPACWVCSKWNEVTFTFKGGFSSLFLHLELYNYEKEEMEQVNPGVFKLSKICPPGKTNFFFSSESKQVFSSDYRSDLLETLICINGMIIEEHYYVDNKECSPNMWKDFFPRAHPRYKVNNSDSALWDAKHSMFKDYLVDNSKLNDQCFEYDLALSLVPALLTESREHSIRILKLNYSLIKDLHKMVYSLSCSSWKAWQETICDLLASRNILDGAVLKTPDLIAMIKHVKSSNNEVQFELARFQFLELVVRVALARFYRGGLISQLESIEIISKEISLIVGINEGSEFRNKKYFNYAVDKVLKKHSQWIVNVFNSHQKDGLLGFKEFARFVAAFSRNEENALKACYLAKETKRYMKYFETGLKFAEFIEAFCRFVDLERVDHDLKKLSLDVLLDIVVNDYFKNKKVLRC